MKKHFLPFLLPLFLSQLLANAITVSGKVLDETSQLPISNANIFHVQGGTTSNTSGEFRLELKNQSTEITFRHVGYKEISLKVWEIGDIVYLKPITLQAKEVYVRSGLREISLLNSTSSVTIIGKSNVRNKLSNHFQGLTQSIPNLNWAGGTSRPRYFQIRGVGERSLYAGEGPPTFQWDLLLMISILPG